VFTPLEEWQSSAFPEQATLSQRTPDFDHDGDGLVNLLEYALGSDPATPTPAPAPQTLTDEGNQYLQIQWTRPNNRTDITTLGEVSDTLSCPRSWTPSSASTATVTSFF